MLLASSLLLSGCAGGADTTSTDAVAAAMLAFEDLQEQLVAVNEAQAQTVGLLRPALDAFAVVDATAALLLGDDSIDDGLGHVPATRVALDLVSLDEVRPAHAEVARRVDEARLALTRTRLAFANRTQAELDDFDATDAVLVALRTLSGAQDALAQVLQRHQPLYDAFVALAEDFRGRRGRYRSRSEAADAFSVEARTFVRDLAVAQRDIAQFLGERDVASRSFVEAKLRADVARAARQGSS